MEAEKRSREKTDFGRRLRYFRGLRGMSQLDLALSAGVSPRHVSFMETGRSRPRAPMVLKLSEVLDVPLRDRNELLRSAGLPPAYPEHDLDSDALAPFREVVSLMLARHEPYPAYVLDRMWNIVDANAAARRFTPGLDAEGPVDALRLFFAPSPMSAMIENWSDVVWLALVRIRREAMAVGNDALLAKLDALEPEVRAVAKPPDTLPTDVPVICPRIRMGDTVISTITTVARFGNAMDPTLDELRVELVFPGDARAAHFFEMAAGGGSR